MILTCTCSHQAQDFIHGRNRRVHNMGKTIARCTVCGDKKPLTADQIKNNNPTKSKK